MPRDSLLGLARQYFRYGYYRAKTSRRHPHSMRRSHLLPPGLVLALPAALAGPGLLRTAARVALAAYLALVAAVSVRTTRGRQQRGSRPDRGVRHHARVVGARLPVRLREIRPAAGRPAQAAARLTAGMRLAVYTDYSYRQDAGEATYGERAFVLFLAQLAPSLDQMVVLGRLDPRPGAGHYRLPDEVRYVPLPHYESQLQPLRLATSLARSLARFWRALDEVDAVWLLGPHPVALGFALLARLRGRRVVLGVRQDLPAYTRSRHPRRRWAHLAADLLDAAWRLLARRLAVVVVGPGLARRYRRARRLLELSVSLVREARDRRGRGCAGSFLRRRAGGAQRRPARDREEPAAARRHRSSD